VNERAALLIDQAYVLAHYLMTHEVTGTDEDERDPVERACDHVAMLAGYRDEDAYWVSGDLGALVRRRLRDAHLLPTSGARRADDAPDFTP
jgi:hypothetical protein